MPARVILVVDGDTDELVARVAAARADLALVDVLARAQLAARRDGRRVRFRDVGEELRGLLELVGLAGVIAGEPRREPELGEQLRVDEVMEPADPPA